MGPEIRVNRRSLLITTAALAGRPAATLTVRGELERAAETLETERAACRKLGLPLFPADLPGAVVAPDQDSVPLYRLIDEERRRLPEDVGSGSLLRISGSLDGERLALLREGLKAWRRGLDLTRRAATTPGWGYRYEWERVRNLDVPPLSSLRRAANLLTARALPALHDEGWKAACRWIRTAAGVARHAARDRTLVGLVVCEDVARMLLVAREQVARAHAREPQVLRALRGDTGLTAAPPDVRTVLWDEILLWLTGARCPRKAYGMDQEFEIRDEEQQRRDEELLKQPESLLAAALEARTLALVRRGFEILTRSPTPAARLARLRELVKTEERREGASYRASREVCWVFESAGVVLARGAARRLLADIQIDLLLHRLEHGQFPERLPEAVRDPFTDRPPQYRREGDGFVIRCGGFDASREPEAGPPVEVVTGYPTWPQPSRLPSPEGGVGE